MKGLPQTGRGNPIHEGVTPHRNRLPRAGRGYPGQEGVTPHRKGLPYTGRGYPDRKGLPRQEGVRKGLVLSISLPLRSQAVPWRELQPNLKDLKETFPSRWEADVFFSPSLSLLYSSLPRSLTLSLALPFSLPYPLALALSHSLPHSMPPLSPLLSPSL